MGLVFFSVSVNTKQVILLIVGLVFPSVGINTKQAILFILS